MDRVCSGQEYHETFAEGDEPTALPRLSDQARWSPVNRYLFAIEKHHVTARVTRHGNRQKVRDRAGSASSPSRSCFGIDVSRIGTMNDAAAAESVCGTARDRQRRPDG